MKVIFLSTLLLIQTILWAQAPETGALTRGDSAYAAMDNAGALRFFEQAALEQPNSYPAAWKLSRALIDIGENHQDKSERKAYFEQGLQQAERAIALNGDGAKGYLFKAIALGRVALDAGAKERVRMSKEIRAAVDKSLALNPGDDIAWHVLGRWHHKIATLSWIEKRFANIFLGGVPQDASLEKAADCFQRAIAIDPVGVSHHFELGVTYEAMGDRDQAVAYFQKTLALPIGDPDDPGYQSDARQHLEHLR